MKRLLFSLSILCGMFFSATGAELDQHQQGSHSSGQINTDSVIYQSATLSIRKISTHTYVHTSFLETESFGKVPCNGMVVVSDHEAVIFDTPANGASSQELIKYITSKMAVKIKAVIATHFHADCVAGLSEFHKNQIPSFAENRTLRIMKNSPDVEMPLKGFKNNLKFRIGELDVFATFKGAGHTSDNIVGYVSADQVLFGGCLIKEVGAGKGNLEDANLKTWSNTASSVKQAFPEIAIVIPGHGKPGGNELIDYTIQLFSKN